MLEFTSKQRVTEGNIFEPKSLSFLRSHVFMVLSWDAEIRELFSVTFRAFI